MYKRLNEDCLPSEHFQRKYSVAKIAQKVWDNLIKDDFELYQHLQLFTEDIQDAQSSALDSTPQSPRSILKKGRISRQSMMNVLSVNSDTSSPSAKVLLPTVSSTPVVKSNSPERLFSDNSLHPKCFTILRGWVEMGFFTWIPEPAVFFLWDQMAMASTEKDGGIIACFERFLPRICCILLKLLRKDLLSVRENMVETLRISGRKLRTRAIVNSFRETFYPRNVYVEKTTLIGDRESISNSSSTSMLSKISTPSQKKTGESIPNSPTSSLQCQKSSQELLPSPVTVSYVTDIEGKLDVWNRFVDLSSVLNREKREDGGVGYVTLKDSCHFVYGGDVCDNGNADVRFTKELIDLKLMYPDRVHFIFGNRDINKLRIPFEICDSALGLPLQPHWLKVQDPLHMPTEKTQTASDSRVDRLKWILENSMGAPQAFNNRSAELRELQTFDDDEHVVESYMFSLSPNGLHTKYLMYSDIAYMIGDTLFVHGALNMSSAGYVPPYNGAQSKSCQSLQEWIEEINKFAKFEINAYVTDSDQYIASNPHHFWSQTGGYSHPQPGSRLLNYAMGNNAEGEPNPTVIYADFYTNGQPEPISETFAIWLKEAGVRRIIVGYISFYYCVCYHTFFPTNLFKPIYCIFFL